MELELVASQEESPAEFAIDMLRRDERADSLILETLEEVLRASDRLNSVATPMLNSKPQLVSIN